MEENVALDSNKQKQFVKSLKGLKKLMKKAGAGKEKPDKKGKVEKEEKREGVKLKHGKVTKKKLKPRGLVYLSHIPHGFYEHEMTQYFKQFGVVTNARVIRSKRTGRSKGHAFVEFKSPDVAQVVAETMNNYLMGKRLIKSVYIPPKDQRRNARRKNWNDQNNPGTIKKLQMKKAYNSIKTGNDDIKIANKLLSNLSNTKSKLKELGIDYDFFTPVDVPEVLSDKVVIKKENDKDAQNEIEKKSEKKGLKRKLKEKDSNVSEENNDKKHINVTIGEVEQADEEENKKSKKKQRKQKKKSKTNNDKLGSTVNKEGIANNKEEQTVKETKKKNKKAVLLKKVETEDQHGQKQPKVKNAEVKPPEDFIKLGNEQDGDSDSSYQFDSDEYENMINNDDSEDNLNSGSGDDEGSNDKIVLNKKNKGAPAKNKNNKGKKNTVQTVDINRPRSRQGEPNKRKIPEGVAVQLKKTKFEKQSNKKLPNKQIKKRK
ncbi:unnamed protein product, partial [Iphiclides podalirius]